MAMNAFAQGPAASLGAPVFLQQIAAPPQRWSPPVSGGISNHPYHCGPPGPPVMQTAGGPAMVQTTAPPPMFLQEQAPPGQVMRQYSAMAPPLYHTARNELYHTTRSEHYSSQRSLTPPRGLEPARGLEAPSASRSPIRAPYASPQQSPIRQRPISITTASPAQRQRYPEHSWSEVARMPSMSPPPPMARPAYYTEADGSITNRSMGPRSARYMEQDMGVQSARRIEVMLDASPPPVAVQSPPRPVTRQTSLTRLPISPPMPVPNPSAPNPSPLSHRSTAPLSHRSYYNDSECTESLYSARSGPNTARGRTPRGSNPLATTASTPSLGLTRIPSADCFTPSSSVGVIVQNSGPGIVRQFSSPVLARQSSAGEFPTYVQSQPAAHVVTRMTSQPVNPGPCLVRMQDVPNKVPILAQSASMVHLPTVNEQGGSPSYPMKKLGLSQEKRDDPNRRELQIPVEKLSQDPSHEQQSQPHERRRRDDDLEPQSASHRRTLDQEKERLESERRRLRKHLSEERDQNDELREKNKKKNEGESKLKEGLAQAYRILSAATGQHNMPAGQRHRERSRGKSSDEEARNKKAMLDDARQAMEVLLHTDHDTAVPQTPPRSASPGPPSRHRMPSEDEEDEIDERSPCPSDPEITSARENNDQGDSESHPPSGKQPDPGKFAEVEQAVFAALGRLRANGDHDGAAIAEKIFATMQKSNARGAQNEGAQ